MKNRKFILLNLIIVMSFLMAVQTSCKKEEPLVLGQEYEGGIIAYIFQLGDPGYVTGEQHGLLFAPYDQSTGTSWGCAGTDITGADRIALGTGSQNTTDIISGCSSAGIAARICDDLVIGSYDDWYLPNTYELDRIAVGASKGQIGVHATGKYWSSDESNSTEAMCRDLDEPDAVAESKSNSLAVRAVRVF